MTDSWFYSLVVAMVVIVAIYWSRLDGDRK